MSELDKTIEELEAEVLAELEEAEDPAKKGAAPAEKSDLKDESEDTGAAVVDPMQKDAPAKKVAAKAKEISGDEQQKGGANVVSDDFYLATAADIVADPSAPNAFVEGVMEGKEWVWNNGSLVEAHVADLKKKFDVKRRQRQVNIEALEFAKLLEKL